MVLVQLWGLATQHQYLTPNEAVTFFRASGLGNDDLGLVWYVPIASLSTLLGRCGSPFFRSLVRIGSTFPFLSSPFASSSFISRSLSDTEEPPGHLNENEFAVALKLIAQKQSGVAPSVASLPQHTRLPYLKGYASSHLFCALTIVASSLPMSLPFLRPSLPQQLTVHPLHPTNYATGTPNKPLKPQNKRQQLPNVLLMQKRQRRNEQQQ
jgi:hypothetical protein